MAVSKNEYSVPLMKQYARKITSTNGSENVCTSLFKYAFVLWTALAGSSHTLLLTGVLVVERASK